MMSEPLFAKFQTNRMGVSLVLAIALGAPLLGPSQALGQWKLEKSPAPKASEEKKSSEVKTSKRRSPPKETPPKEKAPKETVQRVANATPEPPKPTKPVTMRVVEKDHQRFVHVPRATVRCGPGADYYPTGTLSKGTAVEVYVETDDGWSGIRPPAGSHNWVQADSLYLMPGGRIAEVSTDNAPAWVGSEAVKNEKLLYQTELVKTQTVSILGEAYRGQGDEKKLWFRIAPPQGEFRWIKSSMIGVTPVAKDPEQEEQPTPQTPLPKASAVAQAAYQEPGDSKLAWSDEDEQTQRIQQEIQREQQQAQASILAKAPKGAAMPSGSPATRSAATRPAGAKQSPAKPRTSSMPRAVTTAPNSQRIPQSHPSTSAKGDPWQLIHQRQVGPEQTDSMNHILGIFGLSMVDPNNIQGHPQQGRVRHAPAPRVPYANAMPSPSNGPLFSQGYLSGSNPAATTAGIDHLPRPSGRYSPRRSADLGLPPMESFADRPSPLLRDDPADVSTASFAPYPSAGTSPTGTQAYATEQEIESFQTPQIQDALTQLSVIVSRPAEQWNLAPLRDSAMMWIERGETPLVRGEARLLLDRIERFESVRQRSSVTPLSPPTNYSDAVPLRSPASESEMSGWLVAVHTSLPGQPEFALTDDLGNVKAYVRPTTGLNLRRYVQQPVTVFGPQGFLPNLNAKQVVADRVVRLR